MSFRQIFDRLSRIARSGSFDPFADSFDDELRRAQELIDAEKRRDEGEKEAARERNGAGDRKQRSRNSAPDEQGEEDTTVDIADTELEHARAILGVTAGASLQEITVAYRKRIVEVHPDRHQNGDAGEIAESKMRTQELNRAYVLLKSWRSRQS